MSIHKTENWQTVFLPPATALSIMLFYPKQGTSTQMCRDWDTFELSQGHITKNQPMAVSA